METYPCGYIFVNERTLPEAWEEALRQLNDSGLSKKTAYDADDDMESLDTIATIIVDEPDANPSIHRVFPGSIEDLEKYRAEVLYGIHDHWINPSEGKWSYTYHERLHSYDGLLNQIDNIIEGLKVAPHSRREQAIVWQPENDIGYQYPPCLQRIWCTVKNDKLEMHVTMRSNDAWQASFMNMWAFVELQKHISNQIEVEVGRYVHFANSYHVYGKNLSDMKETLESLSTRSYEDRVYYDDFAFPFLIEACDAMIDEINEDFRISPENKDRLLSAISSRKAFLTNHLL